MLSTSTLKSYDPAFQGHSPIMRAAFDLGSGTFKVAVAEVYGNKVKLKFAKIIKVGLGTDLAENSNGSFSEKIQMIALNALKELHTDALKEGAIQFSGIATASFRQAKNGKTLLDFLKSSTGISLKLVSQRDEGILAFKTCRHVFPELNENQYIALDLGAASFQIAAQNENNYLVHSGSIGVSNAAKVFSEKVRGVPFKRGTNFLPITLEDVLILNEKIRTMFDTSQWLQEKLEDKSVVVLYLDDWVDEIYTRADKNENVSRNQIWQVLLTMLESPDELPQKQSYILSLVLLHAIMSKLQIPLLRTRQHTTGCALGIMTDGSFWNQSKL